MNENKVAIEELKNLKDMLEQLSALNKAEAVEYYDPVCHARASTQDAVINYLQERIDFLEKMA